MAVPNLDYIRTLATPELPDLGAKLYEALNYLNNQSQTLAQQTNANGRGQPVPPAGIAGLKVTAQNGHFSAEITDPNPIYRGVNYWLEHADNPHFINPIVEDLGQTRNWHDFLGSTTRYFRAYSSYASSAPSAPAYHGSQVTPLPVSGGGAIGGGPTATAQGSGTGAPGVGLQGPGLIPFRSATGAAPVR